jgi:hypothetical protein
VSRAAGKHGPRWVGLDELFGTSAADGQSEGARREEGATEDERVIPGGIPHHGNPPVKHPPVPVPEREWPYRRALLAHGVPPDGKHSDRDPRLSGGQRGKAKTEPPPAPLQTPVPVVIVEKPWRDRPQAITDTRRITLPAASAEPVMICGANQTRSLVQLLNEDTTHQARFGQLEDLIYDAQNTVVTGGARIPAGASGYTVFRSQDELYAISETSSTVVISVILESEVAS